MTLPVPLTLRLSTSRGDRHVKTDLLDLSFRSVIPRGFASAQFTLSRPLTLQPDEIAYYGRVYVYDEHTGRVAWEGRLEDPGRAAGDQGPLYALVAVGPSAHAQDRTVPLHYVDQSLDRWEAGEDPEEGRIRMSNSSSSEGIPAIRFTLPRDTVIPTGLYNMFRYRVVDDAGLKLARVSGTHKSGDAFVDLATELLTRTGIAGAADVANSQAWSTSAVNVAVTTAGTITNGRTVVELRLNRTSSTQTILNDAATSVWRNPIIQAMRYTKEGTEITTGYSSDTLRGDTVVNDLLGRLLNQYDGANASVETTAYNIDQLVYPDGTTAADVLDDLMLLELAYYWAAWESNSAGLHRFEWRSWPTTVRYEADIVDGYTSTGSAEGLYNRVTVRYRDRLGKIRFYRHTGQPVPELDDAGLIREAFLDLGDTVGSIANATQVAAPFLAEHRFPPNAGILTVARPILDRDTATMVQPWEIRPGHLIRVRGITPHRDSLNASTRDGVTVFKVAGVEFNAGSAAATLELDSHSPSVARAIAKLSRNQITRRR